MLRSSFYPLLKYPCFRQIKRDRYRERFLQCQVWERGERELRAATGVWDRKICMALYLFSWKLSPKMLRYGCSANVYDWDGHSHLAIWSEMEAVFPSRKARSRSRSSTNDPWWKNVTIVFPRVSPEEVLFNRSLDGSGMTMPLSTKYRCVKWMVDLSFKFYKAERWVIVTCADTLVTANASLQFSEHSPFFGYEKNSVCFQDALLSLVTV